MQAKKTNSTNPYILAGVLVSAALTVVIGLTAANVAGNFGWLNELIRIPVIDYAASFLLYGIYLLINWIINLFRRPTVSKEALTD